MYRGRREMRNNTDPRVDEYIDRLQPDGRSVPLG